jgi:2-amino-4-hydroxy-6-hydroxymethyldihydropteridine diphosphokinase
MSKKSEAPKSKSPSVIIALGSNLGNPRQTICDALARLQEFSASPILKSSLWQTTPVHCPPQSPKFVNAVVALTPAPGETPESLLGKLQALEQEFGRTAVETVNAPRPLDLDLIAFGGETRATPQLKLPHPRAHKRRFVIQPLNEILSDLVLPGQTQCVSELLHKLPDADSVEWLSSPI